MFRISHRLSGGAPTQQPMVFKDSETLTRGDIVNLEGGLADLAVSGDTDLLGIVLETKAGTAGVTEIRVATDRDIVLSVKDPNARRIGDTLDLTGTTGAQGVTASANRDFVVIANCNATQETLVVVNADVHWLAKAR